LSKPRLSHRAYERLLRILPRLYACLTLEELQSATPFLILEIAEADGAGWFEFNVGEQPEVVGFRESKPVVTRATLAGIPHAVATHPHVNGWLAGDVRTRRMSDLQQKTLHRYFDENREAYRGIGVEQATVPLVVSLNRVTNLSLRRTKKHFRDEDIAALALLRPHVQQALANAKLFEATRRAAVRLTTGASRAESFTERESQVAFWIAEGKTNIEIGLILGIGSRTVEKHVETILRKLHVENRTTAALSIADALRRDALAPTS
jgi:DNA-binding CsgD family transcriptional regulator